MRSTRRAATLLEMLIVAILLMGMISTIASFSAYMPHWAGITDGQLNIMRESMAAAALIQGEISRAGDCACASANEVRITNAATGDQWLYYLVPHPGGVAGRFELRASKDGKINFIRVAGLVKTLTCTTQPQYNGVDLCLVYEDLDGRLRRECAQFRRATPRTMEVKMADIDRDGFKDLMTVRPQREFVQFYRGLADGTYRVTGTATLNAGSEARSMAVVDFDGNGRMDIAVLTTKDVQILEASPSEPTYNATFGFTYPPTQTIAMPTGASPMTIAAGDVDNDGATDLVVSDYAGQCVQILYGQPANQLRFDDPVRWPIAPATLPGRPRRVKLARMDTADSNLDLVVGLGAPAVANQSLAVALGGGIRGATQFAAAVGYASGLESFDLDIDDIDRDGVLDVVSADWNRDRLVLHTGTAAGALGAAAFTTTVSPTAVGFVDFDGVAPRDVVAVERLRGIQSKVNVYQGSAAGTIGTTLTSVVLPSSQVDAISAATGNVSPDCAEGWAAAWMTADPGGVTYAVTNTEVFPGTMDVRLGDLNRDGYVDAVTVVPAVYQYPRYLVQTYEGAASGTFNTSVTLSLATPLAIPRSLAIEDYDRDGKPDIAVLTTRDVQVLSSASGYMSGFLFSVASTTALPANARPFALEAADLDRDGKADLVVTDAYDECVYVYYGNGDGTFTQDASGARWPAVGTSFPGQPRRMAIGDLNRDGKLDLVVGMVNPSSANRCVAVATGTAVRSSKFAFASGSPYLAGSGSHDVALGDLVDEASSTNSRDGILDVISADWAGGQVALLRGQSSGNLLGTAAYTATPSPYAVRFVQHTADAIPDVAVLGRVRGVSSGINVYQGTSGGAIGTAVLTSSFPANRIDGMSLATGNVSPDNRDDWVAVCQTPGPGGLVTGTAPVTLTGGTVGNTVSLTNTNDACGSSVVADFNRDGYPDIISPRTGGTAVYRWTHNGSATAPFYGAGASIGGAAGSGREIVAADFNRDGYLDVVVTCETVNSVSYYRGTATGFAADVVSTTDSGPKGIAVGDFDRDGVPDIVVAAKSGNSIRVMPFNSATSRFSNSTYAAYSVGNTPNHIAAADLNQDGKLDIVTSNEGGDSVTIRFGNGDGTFQAATTLSETSNSDPSWVELGDLNLDGILDIAVAHRSRVAAETSNGSVWVRLGSGNFTWATQDYRVFDGLVVSGNNTGRGVYGFQLVDVDRDGDLDMVAVGYSTTGGTASRAGMSRNNGAGGFPGAIVQFDAMLGGVQPASIFAVDARRGGIMDCFITHASNLNPRLCYGN